MTCPYCQTRPQRTRYVHAHPVPMHCGHPACRQARTRAIQSAWKRAHYQRTGQSKQYRAPYTGENSAAIEAALTQARQARLARERATGQRTFTVTPWEQRLGAGHWNDGDEQGGGWS